MSLSRERLAELHGIVGDCKRFNDQVARHTLGDVREALRELLAIKEGQARDISRPSEIPASETH